MKSTEMIKDLFINYVDGVEEMPRKYQILNDKIDTSTKYLERKLNKKDRKKLLKLCDDFFEVNGIECEESFVCGFAFATQLLSSAFSYKF